MAAADINDDQRVDIIIANYGSDNVGVRLNLGNGMFTGQTTYSTGSGSEPYSVIVADVNGDNKPDIIVADSGTNNVGVLLNLGNTMFTSQTTYSTGGSSSPQSVVTADINGDNKPDIIVANSGTNNVGVLLNLGNAMFTAQTTYSTGEGSSPQSVAAMDVNGDNKLDLIVAKKGTNNVGVLLNTGNGTFASQTTYSTGEDSSPQSVTTADVNGDNKPDIVVANYHTSNVGVLFNLGNGMFTGQTTYSTGSSSEPYYVTTGDVNGDNKLDIIVANSNANVNTVGVLLNRGNGTFANQRSYQTGSGSHPTSVVAADIDGDRKLDIIVAHRYGNKVGVFLNTGNGTFTSQITYPPTSSMAPRSVITADMNGDNKPDIIVANSGWDNVGVFLHTANGMFVNLITYPTGYGSSPCSLVAVDLNGDSTMDIIVANHGTDNVGVLLNMGGNLLFTRQTIYSTGLNSGPQSVLMVDVNNDSRLDIIVANEGSNSVGVFLNIGNGSFTSQSIYSTGYGSHSYSVATADINSDNKPDIIVANYGTNNIGILLNMENGIFSRQTTYSTGPNSQPSSVITVDVNDDNKLDIVVANSNGNNIGVLLNTGNGTLTSQTVYSTGTGSSPRSLTTADMNGDNKPDIIVANGGTDNVGVLLNLGDGTFIIQAMYSTGYGASPQSVTTADVDRDGTPDIIVANYVSNIVDVLVNLGHGMFTRAVIYSTGDRSLPNQVTTADVNGDNKPEIFVLDRNGGTVAVYLNLGHGMFSSVMIYSTDAGSSPGSMIIVDVSDDNRSDLIVVDSSMNRVGIFLNTGNGTFSTQTRYSTGLSSSPSCAMVVDVNGDNKRDILVANSNGNNVGVFLNLGHGTFSGERTFSTGPSSYPWSMITADVNGDNKPDIIVANRNANNVGVFVNLGQGTFSTQTTYTTRGHSSPYSVIAADVNGDNRPDILVGNADAGNFDVFVNLGQGTFFTPTTFSTGPGSYPQFMITADVNGDNKPDIIVAPKMAGAVGVLLNAGNGTFADVMTYSTVQLSDVCALTVVDIDGDNNLDIVYSSCERTFTVLRNTGNGSFIFLSDYISDDYTSSFSAPQYLASPVYLTSADVNGDNKFDIIVVNYYLASMGVFLHC